MAATRTRLLILTGLAGLAILAYAPVLSQPFISDDYANIRLARAYGPVSGWQALAADPVHRYRPVFLIVTFWIDHFFGAWPPAFYAASIALHIINTWLVFGLGVWRSVGWRVSAVAASFFAVYEGHQEAVMWYSAAYELLLFFFAQACLLFWILWLQQNRRRGWQLAAALVCFLLALASKESAVMIAPVLLLPVLDTQNNRRRALLGWIPFAGLTLIYVYWVFAGGTHHPRLDDGSFSFHAPVVITWLNSFWRVFWIWGLASLAGLAAWRARQWRGLVLRSAVWIAITLVPYSFLTYMTRVPSRHVYFASAGLAWIVAAGFLTAAQRYGGSRRWVAAAIGAVVLTHNIGYIWVKKRAQYLERAASTEALVRVARRAGRPVYVHRFPYPLMVAREAVQIGAGKPAGFVIWAPWPPQSRELNDFLFSLDGEHPLQKPE